MGVRRRAILAPHVRVVFIPTCFCWAHNIDLQDLLVSRFCLRAVYYYTSNLS